MAEVIKLETIKLHTVGKLNNKWQKYFRRKYMIAILKLIMFSLICFLIAYISSRFWPEVPGYFIKGTLVGYWFIYLSSLFVAGYLRNGRIGESDAKVVIESEGFEAVVRDQDWIDKCCNESKKDDVIISFSVKHLYIKPQKSKYHGEAKHKDEAK